MSLLKRETASLEEVERKECHMTGFCGQDCTFCTYRNTHGCGGCRETQGNPFYGPCRVARCCSVKGLESCAQCRDRGDCALAERMREQRESWQPGPETPPEEHGSSFKTELLGQWLPVLFWMLIASTVVSLGQNLGERAAELTSRITLGISVAMLYVFWKLSVVSRHLRLVWWLQVAGVVLSAVTLLMEVVLPVEESPYLYLMMLVPMAVLEALVPYYFCEGLARELDAVGEWSLGRQWRKLRRCLLGAMGALMVMLVLALGAIYAPALAMMLLLGAMICALVLLGCAIAELVLLWRSGRFFQSLPRNRTSAWGQGPWA